MCSNMFFPDMRLFFRHKIWSLFLMDGCLFYVLYHNYELVRLYKTFHWLHPGACLENEWIYELYNKC